MTITRSPGVALLMEMGTGKSLTSIGITGALWQAGRINRVLIAAPRTILGIWASEFQKYADYDYSLMILAGSADKKRAAIRHMAGEDALQVVVVNYESAWRLEKELAAWAPDLIIADESHKIKTHNISASKAMHRLGALARYKLLLTGTIITGKAIDVFSQYKYLNPAIFGQSFYAFRNRYFNMTGYGNYTPALKKAMAGELMEKLHSIAFRATKEDCLDLPQTTDILHAVELEAPALQVYRALVRDSYAELSQGEITAPNVLTRLLRLSQLTGGFIGSDGGSAVEQISTAKIDALEDILDSAMQEDKKLVIIARFLPELRAISKLVEKKGLRYSIITGEVKNRDEQVRQFQDDPGVLVFIGQIATAGLGITLTAASIMVFYSLDYSMSNFEQTKARIHRVGQRYPCTYLFLVAEGTVDEKVLRALQDKADLAKTLIDDYRSGRNPFALEEKKPYVRNSPVRRGK